MAGWLRRPPHLYVGIVLIEKKREKRQIGKRLIGMSAHQLLQRRIAAGGCELRVDL